MLTAASTATAATTAGDLATQYFADRQLFCAGRVDPEDMERISKATGGKVQSTTNGIAPGAIGECAKFEEVQLGEDRFNLFTGCPKVHALMILVPGSSDSSTVCMRYQMLLHHCLQ
jgi:T-complex protein 1 subunit eta